MSASTLLDRNPWEMKGDAMTMEQHTSLRIAFLPRIAPRQTHQDLAPRALARKALTALRLWRERSSQRQALNELDDRLLSDIGFTRDQVRHETLKYFWQD